MVDQTNAHFTVGRELKLPIKQAGVNPFRNVDRRLFVKEQRKPGKGKWSRVTGSLSDGPAGEFNTQSVGADIILALVFQRVKQASTKGAGF